MRLWRELLGLVADDEPANAGPMGLPQYVRDNLEVTLSEMNLEEASATLTAVVQVQSLIMAQVSQAVQAVQDRVREAAREAQAPRVE